MSDPFPDYDDKTQELAVQENRVLDLEQEVDMLKMDLEKFESHNMELLARCTVIETLNVVLLERIGSVGKHYLLKIAGELEEEARKGLEEGHFPNRKKFQKIFSDVFESDKEQMDETKCF